MARAQKQGWMDDRSSPFGGGRLMGQRAEWRHRARTLTQQADGHSFLPTLLSTAALARTRRGGALQHGSGMLSECASAGCQMSIHGMMAAGEVLVGKACSWSSPVMPKMTRPHRQFDYLKGNGSRENSHDRFSIMNAHTRHGASRTNQAGPYRRSPARMRQRRHLSQLDLAGDARSRRALEFRETGRAAPSRDSWSEAGGTAERAVARAQRASCAAGFAPRFRSARWPIPR